VRPGDLAAEDKVAVCDTSPPLRLGHIGPPDIQSQQGFMSAHVVAWIPLEQDQYDGIRDWLSDLKTRHAGRMRPFPRMLRGDPNWGACIRDSHYTISPAYSKTVFRDPVTGITTYEQYFSCVGFVLACYREGAGVDLVADEDSGLIPLAGLPTIGRVFGRADAELIKSNRVALRLQTDGPWPIMFGGYVLHAMSGNTIELPYSPRFRDICF
jgi:hypothetical protein